MKRIVFMSLPVVAGLVVVGTGQLEYWWFGECQPHYYQDGKETMDPDVSCFSSWGVRLLVAVLVERLGVFIVRAVHRVEVVPHELKELIEAEARMRERAVQDSLLPTLPNGLQGDLQVIFTQCVRPAWDLSPPHPLCCCSVHVQVAQCNV